MPSPLFGWRPPPNIAVELAEIKAGIACLNERMQQIMANQSDLDQALDTFEASLTAQLTEINAAVSAILQKAGPAVDLSAEVTRIQNASATLQSAADNIASEANPTPPPVPPTP